MAVLPEPVAVCRDCEWVEDGSTSWVDDVREEAEVHSILLSHTVDFGSTQRLKREAHERQTYLYG